MGGILFLHGGDAFSRSVFSQEGKGYWSIAFPAVVEKHGYLAVESRGPEALEEPGLWDRYDCVLVARMPPKTMTREVMAAGAESGTPTLFEAPLHRSMHQTLGVLEVRRAKPDAVVTVTNPELIEAGAAFGYPPGGQLRGAYAKPAVRDSEHDWRSLPVPIEEAQAEAWKVPGWHLQIAQLRDDVRVLAHWARGSAGDRHPAVFANGSLTACTFGLFAALAQNHTSEPAAADSWPSSARVIGLETLLLALLDRLHKQAGVVRPRVLPWPEGRSWALNVRHDFDRPIAAASVAELLERHC